MESPVPLMGGTPAVRKCFCSAQGAPVKRILTATLMSGSGTHWCPSAVLQVTTGPAGLRGKDRHLGTIFVGQPLTSVAPGLH